MLNIGLEVIYTLIVLLIVISKYTKAFVKCQFLVSQQQGGCESVEQIDLFKHVYCVEVGILIIDTLGPIFSLRLF